MLRIHFGYKSEVRNMYTEISIHKNIFWFQISVYNVMDMQSLQSQYNLGSDALGAIDRNLSMLINSIQ